MNKAKAPRKLNPRYMIETKRMKKPNTNIKQSRESSPIRKKCTEEHSIPIYSATRLTKPTYNTVKPRKAEEILAITPNNNTDIIDAYCYECHEQYFDAQSNLSISGCNTAGAEELSCSCLLNTALQALSAVSLAEEVYFTPLTSSSQLVPGGDAIVDGRLAFHRSDNRGLECSFSSESVDGERQSIGEYLPIRDSSSFVRKGLPLLLYPMPSTLNDVQPFCNQSMNCYILVMPTMRQLSSDIVPHVIEETQLCPRPKK